MVADVGIVVQSPRRYTNGSNPMDTPKGIEYCASIAMQPLFINIESDFMTPTGSGHRFFIQ